MNETQSGIETQVAWSAQPTSIQLGTAEAVQATIGGTRFYGEDGTIIILAGAQVVSINPNGGTCSTAISNWEMGYRA